MDRTKYRDIIESIKIPEGTSSKKMQEMLKPLNIALIQMIPERLYKYRSCSDNHIKAFEKDEMWMSTSNLFNDSFDTLIQYPVIYGEKRYDAGEFLFYLLGKLLKIPVHNTDIMSQIKLLSYKSKEWQYEQEWRLISTEQKNLFKGRAEAIKLKPNSIYYGYKISEEKYQKLHDIAQAKGLEEHIVTIDNSAETYRMKIL